MSELILWVSELILWVYRGAAGTGGPDGRPGRVAGAGGRDGRPERAAGISRVGGPGGDSPPVKPTDADGDGDDDDDGDAPTTLPSGQTPSP